MILFQNHLVVLDYDPKTDILFVEWPSLNAYDLLEIERTVNLLVDYIRNYDVKNLLIDSSHSQMHPDMDMEAYMRIVTEFALNLQKTRLERSASVVHIDKVRQEQSEKISEQVTKKVHLTIESRNFATREEGFRWLRGEEE
jgi:uncharacterized protein YqgV (UPF0045/DUF77 family)